MNKIDRSNVNTNRVSAKDFPKSGIDLSYKAPKTKFRSTPIR